MRNKWIRSLIFLLLLNLGLAANAMAIPIPSPAIDIIKEVSVAGTGVFYDDEITVAPMTDLVWRMTIVNVGNTDLNNVTLKDNYLPGFDDVTLGFLQPGEGFVYEHITIDIVDTIQNVADTYGRSPGGVQVEASDYADAYVDESMAPVPEPASIFLYSIGLAGIAVLRRTGRL